MKHEDMQKEFEQFVNGNDEDKFFTMLRFMCMGMDALTDFAQVVDISVFSSPEQRETMNFYLLEAYAKINFVYKQIMNNKKIKASN